MKIRLFLLLAVVIFLPAALSADERELGEYASALNARCPMDLDADWQLAEVSPRILPPDSDIRPKWQHLVQMATFSPLSNCRARLFA